MTPGPSAAAGAREPRWLDEREQRVWRGLASLAALLPAALERPLRQEEGITLYEYSTMAILSESPGRAQRLRDLANLSGGSMSRLSQVVTRLEKRGWVRREPDPDDGRTTLARLTDAGMDKVVAAAPGHVEAVRHTVIDPLTRRQQDDLLAISDRLLSALADGRACSAGEDDCDPGPDASVCP